MSSRGLSPFDFEAINCRVSKSKVGSEFFEHFTNLLFKVSAYTLYKTRNFSINVVRVVISAVHSLFVMIL